MPKFTTSSTQIHYQVNGNPTRPALLFSNSLGTDLTMWDAQANALSDDFYVIRYDTRGHGHSSRDGARFGIDSLGLDVLALMDHLSLNQVIFCGISMGGLIGQWLALNRPERLDKLIIANTATKIGKEEGWLSRANAVLESGMDSVADGAAARWFTPGFVTSQATLVSGMIETLRHTDARQYAYCCLALANTDFRRTINRIKSPTLVIGGEHDPVTTMSDAKSMQQAIEASMLCALNASHLSNVEKPGEFNEALNEFLK